MRQAEALRLERTTKRLYPLAYNTEYSTVKLCVCATQLCDCRADARPERFGAQFKKILEMEMGGRIRQYGPVDVFKQNFLRKKNTTTLGSRDRHCSESVTALNGETRPLVKLGTSKWAQERGCSAVQRQAAVTKRTKVSLDFRESRLVIYTEYCGKKTAQFAFAIRSSSFHRCPRCIFCRGKLDKFSFYRVRRHDGAR